MLLRKYSVNPMKSSVFMLSGEFLRACCCYIFTYLHKAFSFPLSPLSPVSYTHLDVYKRQVS